MYVSQAYHILEEYKMLCDLWRKKQFQEFEHYLEGLRKEHLENYELLAEAIYIFESRVMDNPF